MTGIHIRRTDATEAIINSPVEFFIQYMERHLEDDPSAGFFLATDDIEVEEAMREKFGRCLLVNEGKTFGRDSKDGMEDALVDLLSLSKCNRIAGSYSSSFSETAARFGGIPLSIITRGNGA